MFFNIFSMQLPLFPAVAEATIKKIEGDKDHERKEAEDHQNEADPDRLEAVGEAVGVTKSGDDQHPARPYQSPRLACPRPLHCASFPKRFLLVCRPHTVRGRHVPIIIKRPPTFAYTGQAPTTSPVLVVASATAEKTLIQKMVR